MSGAFKSNYFNLFRGYKSKIKHLYRNYSNCKTLQNVDIAKIRNIGILAHIDAGKTTTTERMLFYTGLIHNMGEVHHGNTVTDYMAQERERGITITSAAVSFHWKNHQFNLIDTPGHIDFTMEVEQTLNVLDGAIVVLDGSAGVEAQTLTVWRQADRYKMPRIIFVNKMDRGDADIKMNCESIERKLEVPALCLQLPLVESGKLTGIVDVLSMEKITYSGNQGLEYKKLPLDEKGDPKLWNEAAQARSSLIDKLSEHDDELANLIISSDSISNIPTVNVVKALQGVVLKQSAVPVLLGSAYKNIGVQPLMDSIILYLPSPDQRNKHFRCFEDNLAAKAFKIIHDKQRGPLTFFRIYNGNFNKAQKIYSMQQNKTDQIGKLYVAFADDFKEVDTIKNGNIAVITGLKQINTGDLVTNSASSAQKAKKQLQKIRGKDVSDEEFEKLFGLKANVPEPVFFCSIEPPSLAYQSKLETALAELQKEDPSLRVSYDPETGQTVLGGMGELHIEIIKDRILRDYKIDADLGPLQIAYREAALARVTDSAQVETKIGNSKQNVLVKLSLMPTDDKEIKDYLRLDRTPESASNISAIFPKHLLAVRQGIEVGLAHGPKINSQVVNAQVMLHWLEVGRGTSESMIAATVTQLVQKLLKESGTEVLEPVMILEVVTPEEYLSSILSDLTRRRALIENVALRKHNKVVTTKTPLSELMGYATALRTISSGTATFSMEFFDYQPMSTLEEEKAIMSVRGF